MKKMIAQTQTKKRRRSDAAYTNDSNNAHQFGHLFSKNFKVDNDCSSTQLEVDQKFNALFDFDNNHYSKELKEIYDNKQHLVETDTRHENQQYSKIIRNIYRILQTNSKVEVEGISPEKVLKYSRLLEQFAHSASSRRTYTDLLSEDPETRVQAVV